MVRSGTPIFSPSLKPSSSPSSEESVRQSIEVQYVQVLHLLPIQIEILKYFHHSYLPLCLHIFTSSMSSHFRSGEPIVFHSSAPPMISYFNPIKCPQLIPQHLIHIFQVSFIYHCLNFFHQLIQICQVIFIHSCLKLSFNPSKGHHFTPSTDHSNIPSHLYSSL